MPRFKHGTARNQFEYAMRRSAESRQCPKCHRKSALKYLPRDDDYGYLSMTWCRWDDCDYEKHGGNGSNVTTVAEPTGQRLRDE